MNLLKTAALLLTVGFLLATAPAAQAQTSNVPIPLSYQFYQKLNKSVYDVNTKYHSSIKAYFADDELLSERYDSLMAVGTDDNNLHSWSRRKLTDEHLINFAGDDYKVYADFLPDFLVGMETGNSTDTWLNSRGFQVGGTIGKKFSFYTSGYENQGRFANYYKNFIDSNQVVPGQSGGDKLLKTTKDWAYVTALLSYTPNKYLNFALGYDKNFIGDGYRSMLLSDNAANYSFLRLRATLGNVQYQTIFAYMLDPGAPRLTDDRRLGSRGKWSAIHYLDWNIGTRASIGLFQAVTWADAEVEGKRGFDFNYIHPFVFLRPLETGQFNSPDKMRIGLNAKYELLANTALYGQFMLEEFTAKEFFSDKGYWGNKWAMQLGVKGSDLVGVKGLNYLAEYNAARPYTYSHFNRVSNYAHYNQALAHPFGANFKEGLAILNYSYRRFDIQGQALYAEYGVDLGSENYGKDIFKSYDEGRLGDYNNRIGQGTATTLKYGEVKVSYLLNPKYNLRLEASTIYRQETFDFGRQLNANWFNFGLRSSFRNLYTDF